MKLQLHELGVEIELAEEELLDEFSPDGTGAIEVQAALPLFAASIEHTTAAKIVGSITKPSE